MAKDSDWDDIQGVIMTFIPRHIPSLPLDGLDPDHLSEDLTISFIPRQYRIVAKVYDENGFMVDELIGEDFMDAYNRVRTEYPQASWRNPNDI